MRFGLNYYRTHNLSEELREEMRTRISIMLEKPQTAQTHWIYQGNDKFMSCNDKLKIKGIHKAFFIWI